ncbi:MAG: lytic transglycosylase domain-containing protein [Candidatus Contendobacter sp.]
MTRNASLDALVAAAAQRHTLPVSLIRAIVHIESGGNPWAVRYEPAFYDRYVMTKPVKAHAPCSVKTESRLRATSFGLMQIMGQTARETGFDGVYLTELCDPAVGLDWSCTYLARLVEVYRSKYGMEGVVAAYNAGSPRKSGDGSWVNQAYVDKIRQEGGLS